MFDKMDNFKKYGFFIGLVILFGGLNLAILLSHMSRYFGFALIILGLVIIYFTREERPEILRPAAKKEVKERPQNLGQRFIHILTLKGALKPYLFIFGILVLAVVIFFNIYIADEFVLGSNDYVMLLLAGALMAYNFVPAKFNVERDFALIFITLLFLILVIPTTAYAMTCPVTPDSTSITDNTATSILLTSPTVALSRLFGVEFLDVTNNFLVFDGPDDQRINLSIGISCTGLYSVAIFVSAFIAFIFVEYNKINRKVMSLLGLGIFLAWLANIIRMTIIVLVGRHYGRDQMEWTHNNIGEIIFMVWVTIFWVVMFKYLGMWDDIGKPKKKGKPDIAKRGAASPDGTTAAADRKPRSRNCELCEGPLSHTIPAYRCECGKIYHKECTASIKNCPVCHRTIKRNS